MIEILDETIDTRTLPCIRCDKRLEGVMDPDADDNQPSDGTEFTSYGHYGSDFDPMDGTAIAVNLCDDCLHSQAASILHYPRAEREQRPRTRPVRYSETLAQMDAARRSPVVAVYPDRAGEDK